jgi:hypothetical protein
LGSTLTLSHLMDAASLVFICFIAMGPGIPLPGVSEYSRWLIFYLVDCEIASYGGPAALAHRLNEAAADWTAQGDLDFLNNW